MLPCRVVGATPAQRGSPLPCVTPRQPPHRCTTVPAKVGSKRLEHREFGVLTALGTGTPKSHWAPGSPAELRLLEAVGWLFYSSHGDVGGRLAFS